MTYYPVMFTFRDAVSGNGFLSGVTVSGRATLVREADGKWWMNGVRPAAITEMGSTAPEAFANFRNAYRALLFDFAADAKNHADFKGAVERFYHEGDAEEENIWASAVEAIRNGDVAIEAPFTELPKESPERRPAGVSVEQLNETKRYTAADNVPDLFEVPMAAAA
jgi:hypothetical protein